MKDAIKTLVIDLHGLNTFCAVEKTLDGINKAVQEGFDKVLVIHGKSGGKLKQAVNQTLKNIFAVKKIECQRNNRGVTNVYI